MRYIYFIITVIIAFYVLNLLTSRSGRIADATILKPNPNDLTISSILPGETRQGKIEFVNSTDCMVEIEGFRASCRCTTLEFPRKVPPGARFDLAYSIHVDS